MNKPTLLVDFACENLVSGRDLHNVAASIRDIADVTMGGEFDHCAPVGPDAVRIHVARAGETDKVFESKGILEEALDGAGIEYCGIRIETEEE